MLDDNIKQIIDNIKATGKDVTIVCATKTVSAEIINTLPSYGLTIAGENKVQELLEKYDKVHGVEWHLIGQLQTNKVKYIADKVSLIQSLDRISLAEEINKRCAAINKTMNVLIEVNLGEENKGGVPLEQAGLFAEEVRSRFSSINVAGLMAVMPFTDNPEKNKNLHLQMKALYDKLNKEGFSFKYLSIGMSGDYMTAIKYGANMVRLGSALFGARKNQGGTENG